MEKEKTESFESLIIEASPRGISAVTVRVSRDHRERGIALLQKALDSMAQLDQALRSNAESNRVVKR